MPIAQANGINIYYEIHGKGQPLLVITGLSIDLTTLETATSELSKSYRVITFDNRGAGRSDKPDIPYTIDMMANDTAELLRTLGIGPAHVMGISLGGRIAIALTLQYPELVKSLTLVSTGAKVPSGRRRRVLFLLLEIPRRIGALGKEYPQPHYAYANQRKASENFDATQRLHEIQLPTLILHGQNDRFAPYKLAEEMHSRITGSKMITVKGGHLFLFWRQKEFIEAVVRFIESQTGRPALSS